MSQHLFIPSQTVEETLSEKPAIGKRVLESFFTHIGRADVPFSILEDMDVVTTAEAHADMGDLFIGLEGSATFTVGGTLVNPRTKQDKAGKDIVGEERADRIEGGEEYTLGKGDMLWIPPRVPHAHRAEGVARMLIIKVPTSV